MQGGPLREVLAALTARAAQYRVMVLGADSEAWAAQLRSAGMDAQVTALRGDAVSQLDALATLPPERAPALLVLPSTGVPDGIAAARSALAVLGPRLGWCCHETANTLLLLTRELGATRRMRWIGEGEVAAMRQLFRTIFGHEMSAEHWQWKYAQGAGSGLGLWVDGELLAHYGGTTRAVLAFGAPMVACQVCDVMVAPQARAALARRGPLAQLTATFLEHRIGEGTPHHIGFGFPSDRHFGVAQRLGLYEAVDEMVCVWWPAAVPPRGDGWRWRSTALDLEALREGSKEWQDIARLWQTMAAAFTGSVLGVRAPEWLRLRYARRPGLQYEVLLLRSRLTRRARGAVVLRRHTGFVEIVDLIGPPDAFAQLVHAARQRTAMAGAGHCQAWITASHAAMLQSAGVPCRVERLGITVPANAHTPGPAPARFRDKWFLMSGDTDFR